MALHPHLARATLVAAGQPAWPAAVEFFSAVGGSTLSTPVGEVRFEPPELADVPEGCAVGTDSSGHVWWVDEAGALWVGGECLGEAMDWLRAR